MSDELVRCWCCAAGRGENVGLWLGCLWTTRGSIPFPSRAFSATGGVYTRDRRCAVQSMGFSDVNPRNGTIWRASTARK